MSIWQDIGSIIAAPLSILDPIIGLVDKSMDAIAPRAKLSLDVSVPPIDVRFVGDVRGGITVNIPQLEYLRQIDLFGGVLSQMKAGPVELYELADQIAYVTNLLVDGERVTESDAISLTLRVRLKPTELFGSFPMSVRIENGEAERSFVLSVADDELFSTAGATLQASVQLNSDGFLRRGDANRISVTVAVPPSDDAQAVFDKCRSVSIIIERSGNNSSALLAEYTINAPPPMEDFGVYFLVEYFPIDENVRQLESKLKKADASDSTIIAALDRTRKELEAVVSGTGRGVSTQQNVPKSGFSDMLSYVTERALRRDSALSQLRALRNLAAESQLKPEIVDYRFQQFVTLSNRYPKQYATVGVAVGKGGPEGAADKCDPKKELSNVLAAEDWLMLPNSVWRNSVHRDRAETRFSARATRGDADVSRAPFVHFGLEYGFMRSLVLRQGVAVPRGEGEAREINWTSGQSLSEPPSKAGK